MMDRWVNRWVKGWVDRWVDKWVDAFLYFTANVHGLYIITMIIIIIHMLHDTNFKIK